MQLIVAKILIDQNFFIISNFYGILGIYEIPWIISQIITASAFIIFVNAYNFIDGIDGLAISETIKNLLFFSFIYFLKMTLLQHGRNTSVCLYSILFFSTLEKGKKVFLGDAGSLFLGGVNIILLFHLLNPGNK